MCVEGKREMEKSSIQKAGTLNRASEFGGEVEGRNEISMNHLTVSNSSYMFFKFFFRRMQELGRN